MSTNPRDTLEAAKNLHADLCRWIGDDSEMKPIAAALDLLARLTAPPDEERERAIVERADGCGNVATVEVNPFAGTVLIKGYTRPDIGDASAIQALLENAHRDIPYLLNRLRAERQAIREIVMIPGAESAVGTSIAANVEAMAKQLQDEIVRVAVLATRLDVAEQELAAARAERDAAREAESAEAHQADRERATIRELRARVAEVEGERDRLREVVAGTVDPLFAASFREALRASLIRTLAEERDALRREVEEMRAALAETVRIAHELQAAGRGGPHVGLVAAPAAEALLPGNGAALGGPDAE